MNHLDSLWNLVLAGSLRSTVLIGCVLLLRWLLRGRVPAQCFHLLWLLVGVRLLLPVAPSSSTSVFNLLRAERMRPQQEASDWTVRKEPVSAPVLAQAAASPASGVASRERARFNLAASLPGLWVAGVLGQVLLLTSSARRLRRSLADATRVDDPRLLSLARQCAETLGLRREVELLETDALAGPAVIGLWRPRLLLPRGLRARLTDEQMRFVLLHECAHLRRHDLVAMWLLAAARIVHWFNPFVWLATRVARTDAELACDETVLCRSTDDARGAYGETLLSLAQLVVWRQPALPAAGILENRRALRARLVSIGRFSGRAPGRTAFAIFVLLGVGLVFAADEKPAPAAGEPATSNPAKKEHAELIASAAVASPHGDEAPQGMQIEIESRFIETTDTTILRLKSRGTGVALLRAALRDGPDDNVLTSEEAAEFFRALNSASGVDLLSAPKVTTKPGQRAVIEIIREFRYPSEWERNEEKQLWVPKAFATRNCGVTLEVEPTVGADGAITLPLVAQDVEFLGWRDLDSGEAFQTIGENRLRLWSKLPGPRYRTEVNTFGKHRNLPVFSARKRETTVTLQPGETVLLAALPETEDVQPFKSPAKARQLIATISASLIGAPAAPAAEPVIRPDSQTIDLNLVPKAVGFEGFIDYGSAIQTTSTNALGQTIVDVITPNVVNQPIFSTRKVTTSESAFDGTTVVLGGLMREGVQKVEDFSRGIVRTGEPAVAGAAGPAAGEISLGIFRAGDKPGFVRSPHAPEAGLIDVRGFPPGTEIKCPYTQKILRVP